MLLCRAFTPRTSCHVRKHHIALPHANRIVLYGGVGGRDPDKPGQIVVLNPKTGSINRYSCQPTPDGSLPPTRSGLAAARVKLSRVLLGSDNDGEIEGILIVGGWRGQKLKLASNDVWFLDVGALTWHRPVSTGHVPDACNFATLDCLDERRCVLFRGGDGVQNHNELTAYDLKTGVWSPLEPRTAVRPPPRSCHGSCVYDKHLFIFGGWDGKEPLGDLWVYSGDANVWTQLDVSGGYNLGARAEVSLAVVGDVMVLYGGSVSKQSAAETLLVCHLKSKSYEKGKMNWEAVCARSGGEDLKRRVAHQATALDNTLVITGGKDATPKPYPLDGSDQLRPASSVLYIHFDTQAGFAIPRTMIDLSLRNEQNQYLTKFACVNVLSDVRFDVNGVIIPAHRLALALSSRVFRRMFTSGLAESRGSSVKNPIPINPICGAPAAVFEIFLRFCYTQDLATSILHQSIAPWHGQLAREAHASVVATVLSKVGAYIDHSLLMPEDPPDYVRVFIPPEFLGTEESVPFPRGLVAEHVQLLLQLLQMADEFSCAALEAILPMILGALLTKSTSSAIAQTAVAYGVTALVDFVDWKERCKGDSRSGWKVDLGVIDEDLQNGVNGLKRSLSPLRKKTPPTRPRSCSSRSSSSEDDLSKAAHLPSPDLDCKWSSSKRAGQSVYACPSVGPLDATPPKTSVSGVWTRLKHGRSKSDGDVSISRRQSFFESRASQRAEKEGSSSRRRGIRNRFFHRNPQQAD